MDKQFSTESMSNRHTAFYEPERSKCVLLENGHLLRAVRMEANNKSPCHSAVSLVDEQREHTCYSFSEIILESAVYMLPIDHLI